ncbi:MAG: glycosyltransferase family 4 protein [Candidatus Diapherotrites archaeon]|nr:glycosyltransferase family 4 protein [Candidatus Diapherotrites archaeon]
MKIALLSPRTIRHEAAGIEQNVLHIGKYLQCKGHKVEIFCTAPKPERKTVFEGLQINEFPAFAPSETYFFSPALYSVLLSFDGEIIHCNGFNNLVSVVGILAKKKGQLLIITMNSSGTTSWLRKALRFPLLWFYQFYSHKIDRVICVSKWEYEYFKQKLPLPSERFIIIPNGIDVEEFHRVPRKAVPGRILSVGRLVRNKGMHRLIEALPMVKDSIPQAELHIVGTGPEEHALKEQARRLGLENRVIFHGSYHFSERPCLIKLFRSAKVFALLTDAESQGIVFGEAAAAGLPILLADKGVMHEYVAHGAAMGIRNPDSKDEVAKGLIKLLRSSPSTYSSFVWSWEKVGKAVEKVYLEVWRNK